MRHCSQPSWDMSILVTRLSSLSLTLTAMNPWSNLLVGHPSSFLSNQQRMRGSYLLL